MTDIRFTGFPSGETVTLSVTQDGQSVGPMSISSWKNTPAPAGNLAVDETLMQLDPADWSLTDEPSMQGNTAALDILRPKEALTQSPGHLVVGYEVAVGETVAPLDHWLHHDKPRYIAVAPGQETTVRLRAVFHRDGDQIFVAGPWSASKPVTPSQRATPLVVFHCEQTTGTAPCAFQVRAEARGFGPLDPFKDLRYRWTGPGDEEQFTNLPGDFPWGGGALFSPIGVYAFRTPGVKTLTCEVTDGTTTVTETFDVVVNAFSGVTCVVSDSSNFAGEPPGAIRYTSIRSAVRARNGSNQAVRFLLRAGDTFPDGAGNTNGFTELHFGRFGSGPNPIVTVTSRVLANITNVSGDVSFSDIELRSSYDAADPADNTAVPQSGVSLVGGEGLKSFINVHSSGLRNTVNCNNVENAAEPLRRRITGNISLVNCHITNWYDYGVLSEGSRTFAQVGCYIRQKAAAMNDRDVSKDNLGGAGAFAPLHGPIRHSRVIEGGYHAILMCDLGSQNGWPNDSTVQPCIRWNSWGTDYDATLVTNQVRLEGGQLAAFPNNQHVAYPQTVLMDKVLHLAAHQVGPLAVKFAGATIRNVVAMIADTPPEPGRDYARSMGVYGLDADDAVAISLNLYNGGRPIDFSRFAPSRITATTLIDHRQAANAGGQPYASISGALYSEGWSVAGLLDLAVREPGRDNAFWDLNFTPAYAVSHRGRRISTENGGALQEAYATPAANAIFPRPSATSPAVGQSYAAPIDDFYGRLRPASPALGAMEPL